MNNKILAVDDDTDTLDLLTELLVNYGYEVKTVSQAEDALEAVYTFNPDLILLDVNLGKLKGTAICSALKSSAATSYIPIILMSGHYHLVSRLYHNSSCAPNDFILKPFNTNSLLIKIQYLLLTLNHTAS